MKKTYHITETGKKDLEKELEELKNRRGEVADKIAAARDFGDLSENAEYDAAREEQGVAETRIAEIEDILKNAEIIKTSGNGKVEIGSTVDVELKGKIFTYTLVGPVEANPLEGKISNESPMGLALMHKQIGDEVQISTPKMTNTYKVVAIK